jgi:mutator protein MutT
MTELHTPGKPTEVAIGALIHRFGDEIRLLVTRRPATTVYAGYWELPGGKVDPGESAADALVREFREELGITVDVRDPLPMVEHVYPHGHVRLNPFYCAWVAGQPANLQVAEHRWIAPAQLAALKLPEANEPITEQIIADYG